MWIVPRNSRFDYDLFDDFFKDSFFRQPSVPSMKTDIKEVENQFVLTMDLPGFAKEDITISHENGYLTIAAQKKSESEEKDDKGKAIRIERSFGSCKRSFYIGEDVNLDAIKATHNNGVLELTFPKLELTTKETKKYISIE